jgi:putative ABC transport system substrate-binding protein
MTALLLGAVLFCTAGRSEAPKNYLIGSLNTAEQFIDSFEGLRSRRVELGYRDRGYIRYEYFNSRGSDGLLNNFAQKLVQDKLDLIGASSTAAAVAAAKAAEVSRTPILFLSVGNPQKPVRIVSSFGSDLPGISSASLESMGRRIKLPRKHMLAFDLASAGAIDLKIGKDLLPPADQVFE